MANNAIRANTGTYGVNDQPQVGPLMQGQAGVVMTFTLTDLAGTAINLTGKTITGTITNNQSGATAALAGALALVTPASGIFSWTTDAADVGTAGDFSLVFTAGATIITLPAHLAILETPAASTTFGAALVGVTVAQAAWLATALATLPDAADLANVPDPAGATDGYVWTADGADGAGWEAAAGGGGGDFMADGSVPMTDTLELEGIGDGENARVLQVPVSSTDGANVNFVVNSALFNTTYDTTFNWGFNNAGAGKENAAKHAWYLQLEYDYAPAGTNYVEYHLNLFPTGGGSEFRPFQFKYKKDGSSGSLTIKGTEFYVSSIGGTQAFSVTTIGTAPKVTSVARVQYNLPADKTDAYYMYGKSNIPLVFAETVSNNMSFRPRIAEWLDTAAGAVWLTLNGSVGTMYLYGSPLGRFSLTMPNDVYKGLVVKGVAGQTKTSVEVQDSSGNVLFAIAPSGNIRTSQAAANTATPSGATAYQLPVYNAAGTLLGYIPVYGAAWT